MPSAILLFLLPLVLSSYAWDEQCLIRKPQQFYSLISTLTPYDRVRGDLKQFKGCKAQKLWMFQRHGTRFPHNYDIHRYSNLTKLIGKVVENHDQGRGDLCPEDLDMLQDWELVASEKQSMLLTESGIEELKQRGKRLYSGFRHLLKHKRQIMIRFTSKERTRQSAQALTEGLYGKPMKLRNSWVDDDLIKNERNCPAWHYSTESHKFHEETEKLVKSPEMIKLINSVSQRLGFETNLDIETIKDIYDVCRYEYSWYHSPKSAAWCAAFNENDMKVMEYWRDLTYYYKSGYGNDYILKLGCEFIKDIINKFTSYERKATLYFGHSSTNRKLLTALGLAEGDPLRGDGYTDSKHRLWRTSYLTPFAANIVVVLYECEKESEDTNEKLRIAIFVNEKLARLPACGKREMCGFEEFKQKFTSLVSPDFCNRDFCSIGNLESPSDEFFP